jgi:hypothetical protein
LQLALLRLIFLSIRRDIDFNPKGGNDTVAAETGPVVGAVLGCHGR